jgi:beta-lactamase regulating signal transducer with metallopeptidase domain
MPSSEMVASWLPFVLDALVKSVVVIVAAFVAVRLLRRSAAAVRHRVWLGALLATLALPLLSRAVPDRYLTRWAVPAAPVLVAQEPLLEVGPNASDANDVASTALPPETTHPAANSVLPSEPEVATTPLVTWPLLLLTVYSVGVLVILGQVVAGALAVRRLAQGSVPASPDSTAARLLDEIRQVFPLPQIALRFSEAAPVPMTWGWLRPTLLLPEEAKYWDEERVRVALLHEAAHITRRDWPAQMLAHVVCALYWFHPLVWLAATRMRDEAERASDDRVLLSGVAPTDYAGHLLEIARTLAPTSASAS